MVKVIDRNEVIMNDLPYKCVGGVRRVLLNKEIPSINVGPGPATHEERANKWHFANTRGGHGKWRLMGQTDSTDQVWYSYARTDTPELTLLPLATEGIDMGAALSCKPITFNGSVYFFAGTALRRWNGTNYQFWCTVHSTWETHPVTGGHTARTLPAAAVSAMVYNGYLFVWCTSDYLAYDGSTTWQASHATPVLSTYAVEFDNRLVMVNAAGLIRYSTDPEAEPPAWTNYGTGLYIDTGTPTGAAVYEDGGGDPAVCVGSTKGPYILDLTNNKAWPLLRYADEHADNCKGMTVYSASLAYGKGGDMIQYFSAQRGSQYTETGPGSKNDGLPAVRLGRVVDIDASMTHFLLVAMDAGSGSGMISSVMALTGGSWHTLAEADVATESIKFVAYSTVGSSRVWFTQGNSVWWFPLPDITNDPVQASGSTYRAAGGYTTPWFGSGTEDQTAIDLIFETAGISADETIVAYYRLNGDDVTTTTIGTVSSATNGLATLSFAGNGVTFKTIRLVIVIGRGSTNTNAPRIKPGTHMRWAPKPQALWGWQFDIELTEGYKGRTWLEQETDIITACDLAVMSFSCRPADDRKVSIRDLTEITETGHGKERRFRVTVAEQVAT